MITHALIHLKFHEMKGFPQTLSPCITINALEYGFFGYGIILNFEALDLKQWSCQLKGTTLWCLIVVHHY